MTLPTIAVVLLAACMLLSRLAQPRRRGPITQADRIRAVQRVNRWIDSGPRLNSWN